MTNLDSILKSRDITLSTKVRLVKAMVFPQGLLPLSWGCGQEPRHAGSGPNHLHTHTHTHTHTEGGSSSKRNQLLCFSIPLVVASQRS